MLDTPLIISSKGNLSERSIEEALKSLQIIKGDIVFLSSRLFVLGKINLEIPRDQFLDLWIDAFLRAVGPEGTLILPAYSGSATKKEVFHVLQTPTNSGALNERFRLRYPNNRTACPMSSVVAVGKEADFFIKNVASNNMGVDSFYDRLSQKPQSKFVFIGGFSEFLTYVHHMEYRMKVPYRYDKIFPSTIVDERLPEAERRYEMQHRFYCRDLSFGAIYQLKPLHDLLLKRNLLKELPFGNSTISCLTTSDLTEAILGKLREDPFFLIQQSQEDWERSPKDVPPA